MEAEKRKIVFIVNPVSGVQNKASIVKAIEQGVDAGLYDYSIAYTQYAGHATVLAATAVERGADVVVAIGGDGTVNEIGRALVHTSAALGIIPCGSGNGLARHLGIPMDTRMAIDVLNEGHMECIDYGKVNGRLFFCTCGVGFDAFVSLKFAETGKRGLLTYLENTLHEILKYEPEVYEIEDETGTRLCKAFLIACGNAAQYGNNAFITPQASAVDGLMDVTILEPFTVLDVPSLAFQLFNKTLNQNSRIRMFRAKRILIHRSKEGVAHFDGDPMMTSEDVEVEILHKGLNVVCPVEGKMNVPQNFLQIISEYVSGLPGRKFIVNQTRLFDLNMKLLQRLSKR